MVDEIPINISGNLADLNISGNIADISDVNISGIIENTSGIIENTSGIIENTSGIIENTSGINEEEEYQEWIYEDNGWTVPIQEQLKILLLKLRYHRIVNNFYLSNLKRIESKAGWYLILLSTFTSALTVGNNVEEEPFENYHLSINVILTTVSFTTSLIGAWMKKQQYVERINTIDRYFQKLNKICEEIEFELIKVPEDRKNYDNFKEEYYDQIKLYLVPNPAITPKEWKKTVYEITINYPEMLNPDDQDESKMWPWFSPLPTLVKGETLLDEDKMERIKTNYEKNIIETYKKI
jgi:hypothetical protein